MCVFFLGWQSYCTQWYVSVKYMLLWCWIIISYILPRLQHTSLCINPPGYERGKLPSSFRLYILFCLDGLEFIDLADNLFLRTILCHMHTSVVRSHNIVKTMMGCAVYTSDNRILGNALCIHRTGYVSKTFCLYIYDLCSVFQLGLEVLLLGEHRRWHIYY